MHLINVDMIAETSQCPRVVFCAWLLGSLGVLVFSFPASATRKITLGAFKVASATPISSKLL